MAETPKEWRCFHCDEVFTEEACARQHFGCDQGKKPACVIKAGAEQGLVGALRTSEAEIDRLLAVIHNEDSDTARAMRSQAARHADQLRQAEELGYSRGLADMRDAEHQLSDAYLRIRTKLKAFKTPHAPTAEQVWAHTEETLDELLARAEGRSETDHQNQQRIYDLARSLRDSEHDDDAVITIANELIQLSGVCDSCRGDGLDGDPPDAAGVGGSIWDCTACGGSGRIPSRPASTDH